MRFSGFIEKERSITNQKAWNRWQVRWSAPQWDFGEKSKERQGMENNRKLSKVQLCCVFFLLTQLKLNALSFSDFWSRWFLSSSTHRSDVFDHSRLLWLTWGVSTGALLHQRKANLLVFYLGSHNSTTVKQIKRAVLLGLLFCQTMQSLLCLVQAFAQSSPTAFGQNKLHLAAAGKLFLCLSGWWCLKFTQLITVAHINIGCMLIFYNTKQEDEVRRGRKGGELTLAWTLSRQGSLKCKRD